ncbi:MAG: hypothetical protein F6K22_30895 [Okeania sp. SIO2F4]|nr:hypothetical protein [Okeania sp. SIO2F4]NES06837.1 hypothetical protein [Okeania sp. SIO2F4]
MDNTKIAKRVKSRIIQIFKSGNKFPAKEELDWDELPSDVRAEFLRREKN